MHFSSAMVIALIYTAIQHVAADPRYEQVKTLMSLRGRSADLSFCYGTNAICPASTDLHDECDSFNNDLDDMNPWYKCLCENGFVAVDQACTWCENAYGISNIDVGDLYPKGCSSAGVTIAPIPSSILARESSYNATYTGVISGAGADKTGSAIATTSNEDSGSSGATSKRASKSTSLASKTTSDSNTWFGGVTSVVTLNGGGGGGGAQTTTDLNGVDSTSSPSSSLRSGGDSPGGAQGLNTGFAGMLSIVAFGLGLSVLYLI